MAKYVSGCIDYVLEGLIDNELTKPLLQTIPLTNLNMVTQLCNMLEVILTEDTDIRNPQVFASCVHNRYLPSIIKVSLFNRVIL